MTIELIKYDLQSDLDLTELEKIFKNYFQQSPFLPSRDNLRSETTQYFRAFFHHQHIGISGIIKKTPLLAETVKSVVFQDFQGQGLGHKLSLSIEEECRKQGFKKVMTTIYHFNLKMIHIKLKQGYIIEGFHRDHEAPGFHEYSLGKLL